MLSEIFIQGTICEKTIQGKWIESLRIKNNNKIKNSNEQ